VTSPPGQAAPQTKRLARRVAGAAGLLLRGTGQLLLALLVVLLLAGAALVWRLAQGPVAVPWLARRIEAAATPDERVRIGTATLAWNGFHGGPGQPVQLHLTDIRADGVRTGQLADAQLSFPVAGLLAGRTMPSDVTLTGARLSLLRQADGSIAQFQAKPTGTDDIADLLHRLARPDAAGGDTLPARLAALRHLHVHDAAIALDDRQLNVTATLAPIAIDLDRGPGGGIAGRLSMAAHAGGQSATLTGSAQLDGDGTKLQLAVSPLTPAALAGLLPALAPAAAVDAPVTVSGTAELGPDLLPRHLHGDVAIGAGIIHAARGAAPVVSGTVTLDGDLRAIRAALTFVTAPQPDGPRTTFTGHVDASRDAGGIAARVTLGVDHVNSADLAAVWPDGAGGPGTKPWITQNITAGTMRDGRLDVSLHMPPDLSDVSLTKIDGALDGRDLSVSWLKPVPPIEHVDGHLTITNPDIIDIAIDSGIQAGGSQGGVRFSNGGVRLTGIAGRHQFADINADIAGPLADLLHTLSNPRLKLLSRQPIQLKDPAGSLAGHLTVAHLPLEDSVSMDDVAISTRAHLVGVHLGGIAAGRDIDRGVLDLTASNDGLSLGGTAQLAHIPTRLQVDMDFRAGPPSQVTQHVHVAARVSERQLAGLGLPAQDFLIGEAAMEADVKAHRGGQTDIVADADLTAATLTASRIAYAKAAGVPAQAHAAVQLQHDRVIAVPSLTLRGRDVDLSGSAAFAAGRPASLQFDRVRLGLTDVRGVVRLPAGARGYDIKLSGPSLDLSAVLDTAGKKDSPSVGKTATPFTVDLSFGRVLLGRGRVIERFAASAEDDGKLLRRASVTGNVGPAALRASVRPGPGGRTLSVATDDLGAMLHAAGVWDSLRGGRLRVDGAWNDRLPGQPLNGTAVLTDFRVLDAPQIGRILKAATLYGLVDLLRGPGLGFTRLEAPFRYSGGMLDLSDAGVFSPSLGATMQGRIDVPARRAGLSGTIVPAYFFNALPGRLPLVGRLFSPERNGGLFAATYSVRGPLANPSIGVNPAAVLTPGALRRVFDLFGSPPAQAVP